MTRPRLRVEQIVVHYAFAVAVTAFVTSIIPPLRPHIEPRHSPPFLLGLLVVAWVDVTARSEEPGLGSIFTVRLPRIAAARPGDVR